MPNGVMRITLMRDKSHYFTSLYFQKFCVMLPSSLFHHKMAGMIKTLKQFQMWTGAVPPGKSASEARKPRFGVH